MILCKTPLRISFLGGGTDFPEHFVRHGGAVLGTAIDKFIYHSVMPFHSRLFDYSIRVAYRDVECVGSIEDLRHAAFREVLRHVGITKDVEVSLTADLPAFSGLGSSSSFVVGLLNALLAHRQRCLPRLELARQAIVLERERLGDVVGCQDQVFAAMGGLNLIEFKGQDDIVVHRLSMPRDRLEHLRKSLMLFYTGLRRRAAEIEARKLDNMHRLTGGLLEMRRLVDRGYDILTGTGSLEEFGVLLDEGWRIKRTLAEGVSNAEIDAMYATARRAGALGGKLLGAGGGGFLLLFVPPETQGAVRTALDGFYEVEFDIDAAGTQIVHA